MMARHAHSGGDPVELMSACPLVLPDVPLALPALEAAMHAGEAAPAPRAFWRGA